ncbi:MAG TPA: CHAD domain-containing protein [Desulfobacteraceae bacterium]|nr:CHAD domain-containing protein [Desulfobacteraceae bacterium]
MSELMPTTVPDDMAVKGGKKVLWIVPESLAIEPLVADIGRTFTLESESKGKSVATWYDTFDWRLYRRNLHLYADLSGWHLMRSDTGDPVAWLQGISPEEVEFVRHFPASRIRSVLEPILAVRRLLPLFTEETTMHAYRILNSDNKTVARLLFEEHHYQGSGSGLRTVSLHGVRGYDSAFRRMSRFIDGRGMGNPVDGLAVFREGARTGGRIPLDYSSRFRIDLRPEMSVRQAMIAIYRELLETMHRNEPGVLDDLDTEHLHDFRVAIRRTRSGLGQMKDALPAAITGRFRRGFAWLGEITGPTRDLDVYLLHEKRHADRLPERLQVGLLPFFAELRDRRTIEQNRLVKQIASDRYRKIISAWHEYLHSGMSGSETGYSARPIIDAAREIIYRRFGKVIREGKAVGPLSPPEKLHRLRIRCKKLRYLLEFYASLFAREDSDQAIRQLKRLQDNLGDFNDLTVQQAMLRQYLDTLRPGSRKNQETAASLGGLLTGLYHEQQRVRQEFDERFREFARPANAGLYGKLAGKQKRSAGSGLREENG